MAQEPSSGRPQQEQGQNTPETTQAAGQSQADEQVIPLSASGQQADAPDLQPAVDEQSNSPGWTDRGGMEAQQESALAYNEWANERFADHNANLQNAQENQVAEQPAATPELSDGEQEQTDRLQQARDLMAAVNERLGQGQELQNEKVIGD